MITIHKLNLNRLSKITLAISHRLISKPNTVASVLIIRLHKLHSGIKTAQMPQSFPVFKSIIWSIKVNSVSKVMII